MTTAYEKLVENLSEANLLISDLEEQNATLQTSANEQVTELLKKIDEYKKQLSDGKEIEKDHLGLIKGLTDSQQKLEGEKDSQLKLYLKQTTVLKRSSLSQKN